MERHRGADFHIDEPTIVALGNFDGLHKGHAALIDGAKGYIEKGRAEKGEALSLAAFTFTPHPSYILGGGGMTVFSDDERAYLMEEAGVSHLIEYPCGASALGMAPNVFANCVLKGRAGARAAAIGEGYRFGRRRAGHARDLKKAGLDVLTLPPVFCGGVKVSSTDIRGLVSGGDLRRAEELLGKPYFAAGRVERGRRLGAAIGFPTANIFTPDTKILPPDGVYATFAIVGGERLAGVTNVGRNPTVGGARRSVETHIFDFDKDIYGQWIVVGFRKFLRGERNFGGVKALTAAIAGDVTAAKAFWDILGGP